MMKYAVNKINQLPIIALSGFGVEILTAPLLYLAGLWLYPWVVAAHLMAYPFYAGDYNDFKWGK